MGVIYQLTFFLAVAILATLITIFVFAVSLLGRALEAASKEQEKTTREQKDAAEKEIAAIQKQISNLGEKGRIDKEKLEELEAKLAQLRKQDERFEKKLSRIGKAPQLLTVKGGVLPPASWLLGALILTAGAWGLSETQNFVPVTLWILSLAAIGYSIIRIYRSLKVIESVAITSEAEAERRLARAVKAALIELEEEKKPELQLNWLDSEPPFRMKIDSTMKLSFSVFLTKGELAEDVEVDFFAPSGFSFPDRQTILQDANHPICPKFACTTVGYRVVIKRGKTTPAVANAVVIKAPPQEGKFEAFYVLSCRRFSSEFEKFEIVVEEPELEPEDIPF